jgi:hypothetical protein
MNQHIAKAYDLPEIGTRLARSGVSFDNRFSASPIISNQRIRPITCYIKTRSELRNRFGSLFHVP